MWLVLVGCSLTWDSHGATPSSEPSEPSTEIAQKDEIVLNGGRLVRTSSKAVQYEKN